MYKIIFKSIVIALGLFSLNLPAFAGSKISKDEACRLPDNYMEGSSTGLIVSGLKKGYSEGWSHITSGDSYDMLYYIVRQSDMYTNSGVIRDDYSLYRYDCQKKKIHREFWQFTFREITKHFPITLYPHARAGFLGGKYIEVNFNPDSCGNFQKCLKDYYKVMIQFSPHRYTITKQPLKWNPKDPQAQIIYEGKY